MRCSLVSVCGEEFDYLGARLSGDVRGGGKVVSVEAKEEIYGVEICLHCRRDFFGEEERKVAWRGIWWENKLFQERLQVSFQCE